MTWMEISAASSALAFIVLVVFAVRMLITAKRMLQQLSDTVAQTEQHVAKAAGEAEQLLKQVGQLTEEVHLQVLALESTVQSIEKTGAAIGDVASVVRKRYTNDERVASRCGKGCTYPPEAYTGRHGVGNDGL